MIAVRLLAAASLTLPAGLAAQSVAIVGATVIDGTDRPPIPRANVVIRDGRIVAVGPGAAIPAGAVRIDGAGKFVIAGLWDSHVHLTAAGRGALPTLARWGVTSVRDLGGKLDSVRQWRAEVDAGRLEGPRIHLAGPIVENAGWLKRVAGMGIAGLADLPKDRIGIETEDDARRAVDSIAGMGVEVIKVRTTGRPESYRALVEAARQRGLLVAGHQPSRAVGLAGTVAAGQRSIEHIEGLSELEEMAAPARDSMARIVAAGEIWITPTLAASFGRFRPESITVARVRGTIADSEQAAVTPDLRSFWESQLEMKKFDSPLDDYRKMVVGGLAGMRRLHSAGVKMLAGTDLAVLGLYPGSSLHDELAFLVDSLGLSPLEAIRTATVEPARFFRVADSIGTVEPGRMADLLVLTADPLADIRNTRRIEAVVLRGRVLPRR